MLMSRMTRSAGLVLEQSAQRRAVLGGAHPEAGVAQVVREHLADLGLVVDDDDVVRCGHPEGPDARAAPRACFIKLKHGANSRQLHVDGKNRGWPQHGSACLQAAEWPPARRYAQGRRPARNPLCSCSAGGTELPTRPSQMSDRAEAPPPTVSTGDAASAAQDPEAPGSDGAGAVSQLFADRHHRRGAARADGARAARVPVQERASRAARGAPGPGHRAQHPAEQRDQDGGGSRLAARRLERDLRAQRRAPVARAAARRRCPAAVRWRRGAVRAQLRGARRCSGGLLAGRESDPAHAAVASKRCRICAGATSAPGRTTS